MQSERPSRVEIDLQVALADMVSQSPENRGPLSRADSDRGHQPERVTLVIVKVEPAASLSVVAAAREPVVCRSDSST